MRLASLSAITLALLAGSAHGATILGGDYAGGNLTPANGDVLSGTFTNVGIFSIAPGNTVTVAPGTSLVVNANMINIGGTLSAVGAGAPGGAAIIFSSSSGGNPGSGSGFGGGGSFGTFVHGSGGGGGGYGGQGGNSSAVFGQADTPVGVGGATYGNATDGTIQQGSGGGSGAGYSGTLGNSGAGGAGGGSVALFGNTITLTGQILADGLAGDNGVSGTNGTPAGGGGSGGGILLSGSLDLDGLLSALGGDGGDGSTGTFGSGGGGGGGGRIKLFGPAIFGSNYSALVNPGAAGSYYSQSAIASTAGQPGTIFYSSTPLQAVVPEPASLAVWGVGSLACALLARRRLKK